MVLEGAVLGEVGWTIPNKVRGVAVYMSIIQKWDLHMQCRLGWGKIGMTGHSHCLSICFLRLHDVVVRVMATETFKGTVNG